MHHCSSKETKNNYFTWWAVWILCIMENGGHKRMMGILLCNLIVGHTHDKVDRFFSRIEPSLKGLITSHGIKCESW